MSEKAFTLGKIAELLSASLQGDANTLITGIAPLQQAQNGQITFLDNPKYRKFLATTQASAVILAEEMAESCPCAAIITSNPYAAYARVAALFAPSLHTPKGIHPTAIIGNNCQIDASASIGPHVVISDNVHIGKEAVIYAGCFIGENAVVGDNVVLWPRVTLYHDVKVGHRSIIHSGAVIGADGFGFAFDKTHYIKVPQIGSVIIGKDVDIGANTCIDRGALDDTIIEDGVKLDNHIQVGHNVHIGAHTVIAGNTAIAGSTRIGRYCRIGGMVGIAGHLEIADQVVLTAMAGVPGSINKAGVYGSALTVDEYQNWRKNAVRFHHLDDIARKVHKIEKQLSQEKSEGNQE